MVTPGSIEGIEDFRVEVTTMLVIEATQLMEQLGEFVGEVFDLVLLAFDLDFDAYDLVRGKGHDSLEVISWIRHGDYLDRICLARTRIALRLPIVMLSLKPKDAAALYPML